MKGRLYFKKWLSLLLGIELDCKKCDYSGLEELLKGTLLLSNYSWENSHSGCVRNVKTSI